MPHEYEDEAEIYRVEPMASRLAYEVCWGIVIGSLAGFAIILISNLL